MDRSKSENSLYENSMKVVTNMIRMSSISLSHKTLGTCRSAAKVFSGPDKVPEMEPLVVPPQFHGSRLQEPQSRSNPTYVKPTGNDGPNSHEIHKESIQVPPKKDVDDSAFSEYIIKTRKQLGCGFKIQESRKSSSR